MNSETQGPDKERFSIADPKPTARRRSGRLAFSAEQETFGLSGVSSEPLLLQRQRRMGMGWWQDPELNRGHKDFQSSALPTELSCRTIVNIAFHELF